MGNYADVGAKLAAEHIREARECLAAVVGADGIDQDHINAAVELLTGALLMLPGNTDERVVVESIRIGNTQHSA